MEYQWGCAPGAGGDGWGAAQLAGSNGDAPNPTAVADWTGGDQYRCGWEAGCVAVSPDEVAQGPGAKQTGNAVGDNTAGVWEANAGAWNVAPNSAAGKGGDEVGAQAWIWGVSTSFSLFFLLSFPCLTLLPFTEHARRRLRLITR